MKESSIPIVDHLLSWIRAHQTAAFFILAFAITWGLGFSYDAVMQRNNYWLAPLVIIATCGPALAGIILSAVCNTRPREGTKRASWIAFLAAWPICALVFLAHNTIINHAPLNPILVAFSFVAVIPVPFILSMAWSRIPSVRQYLASLTRLGGGVWLWIVLALVVVTALNVLPVVISNLLGRQSVGLADLPFRGQALIRLVAITFFYQIFFFNLTGEEIGWRGFALPRLQARFSPLAASLVLAFFWTTWHFFYFKGEGQAVFTGQFWLESFLEHFPATVLINWFYTRSKGSILVAGVAHAAANTVMQYMPGFDWPLHPLVMNAFALALILAERIWKKLPADHPAVYRVE